ncbi:MAG: nitrophenyl compound nitroreductase subunit ArsF family protein [Prolixibacteraceae bacterium]|jgi:hypothetical protein|nr:nitrophenyl compound nitroreductase subunit ArsF family protein [Prolixibacteraceae bacterium]MDD4755976.1 nitrophenyl compound nitroreductase subunit ArsF family protein [Prolixibacteraceae bacterium]
MKKGIVIFILIYACGIFSANAQGLKNTSPSGTDQQTSVSVQNEKESDVQAYYFHFSRRCMTCRSVERVSIEILEDLYGNKIQLKSVNLDEKAGEDLAKKTGVEGQSLLFINGSKKVDLTVDGFMYAQTDPDKLKEKIKAAVESLK